MGARTTDPVTIGGLTVAEVAEVWLSQYGSAHTRSAYGSDLRAFVDWCDAVGCSPLDAGSSAIAAYRADRLQAGASAASVNRQQSALRAFFTTAATLGGSAAPFESRPAADASTSATPELSPDELAHLFRAARRDPRAEVLVHLLASEGLGLSEALSIDHEHISGAGTARRLRHVRDGAERRFRLLPPTAAAVGRLQRTTSPVGPLLVSRRGTNAAGRLTRFGADRLLKQVGAEAGLDQPLSANVLRRAHVTMAQRSGVALDAVRDRMGHRDVRTTRRYASGSSTSPLLTTPERSTTNVHPVALRPVP